MLKIGKKGLGISLIMILLYQYSWAMPLNMPRGFTEVAHDIFDVHMWVFYVCLGIMFVVFFAMFYILLNYRRSEKNSSLKGKTVSSGNVWVEFIWTLIPTIIVVVMIIPATRLILKVYDARDADEVVRVIGHQWYWVYEYPRYGIKFQSNLIDRDVSHPDYLQEVDHPVVIPVDKKVQFIITSEDVLHSWWVPEFGIKQDAVPLTVNSVWTKVLKKGTYRGKCSELCGIRHAYMPIEVKAVSNEEYVEWIKQQQGKTVASSIISDTSERASDTIQTDLPSKTEDRSYDDLYQKGQTTYNANCTACHQNNGQGMQNVFPSLKGSPRVTAKDPEKIICILLNGIENAAMARYDHIGSEKIAEVLTYIRGSWKNDERTKANGGVVAIQAKNVDEYINQSSGKQCAPIKQGDLKYTW